jgi:hypothetical protein
MSAATELLLEQIRDLKIKIDEAKNIGSQTSIFLLQDQLVKLQKQLNSANEALTEGKQTLLKG